MIIACLDCSVAIRVTGDPSQTHVLVGEGSEYWPDRYPCFRCGAMATGMHEAEVEVHALRALEIVNLTAEETFAALNGLGIPEERICCDDVVKPLFESRGIKLHGRQPRGLARYFIDCMELEDGTKIYLAPSPQGCVIYRIAKPHSYVAALNEKA